MLSKLENIQILSNDGQLQEFMPSRRINYNKDKPTSVLSGIIDESYLVRINVSTAVSLGNAILSSCI